MAERHASQLQQLDFERFTCPNVLALFVKQKASNYLKQVTLDFAAQVKQFGVEVIPKKQLHMSLAYQFRAQHLDHLEKLTKGQFQL